MLKTVFAVADTGAMHDVQPVLTAREVLRAGSVRSVYQPIVSLDDEEVVAVEALARGPVGSPLESPNALFRAAAREGLTNELDWACRAAAVRGALEADLPRSCLLFINAEPVSFRTGLPPEFAELLAAARERLSIVIEVTERAIAADPAALLAMVSTVRSLGFGVAIDDVGVDPSSLALMPFVRPEVIKLDMGLVQVPADASIARLAAAVQADAERRGALILAEGIETDLHRDRALVLGAHLGQGWRFGPPTSLHELRIPTHSAPLFGGVESPAPTLPSPWMLVEGDPRRRTTTKRHLAPMSDHIEQSGVEFGDHSVLAATFQHARHFTPKTAERYEQLATRCGFVAALGVDMPVEPASGVRGTDIDPHHPVAGEWTVAVVGPHHAAALIAIDLGDDGPQGDRRFDYVITHDRDLVIGAARSLMQHLAPSAHHVFGPRPLFTVAVPASLSGSRSG